MKIRKFLFLFFCAISSLSANQEADIIFFGGDILTMDDSQPTAQAVAVLGKNIIYVGTKADTLKFSTANTRLHNLRGKTLLPGFIDSHSHIKLDKASLEEHAKAGFTTLTTSGKGTVEKFDQKNKVLKVQEYIYSSFFDKFHDIKKSAADPLKILGVKIVVDRFTLDQLQREILKVHQNSLQLTVLTKNDDEIKRVLEAYTYAQKEFLRHDARLRFEIIKMEDHDLLNQIAKIGATPVFTTEHLYLFGKVAKEKNLDKNRKESMDCPGCAKNLGLKFSFSEENGPVKPSPLMQIQVNVTRELIKGGKHDTQDSIDVGDALKAFTTWAAWQTFQEHEIGSLEVGKLADFVILDKNPLKVAPSHIHNIHVKETWIEGKKVNLK